MNTLNVQVVDYASPSNSTKEDQERKRRKAIDTILKHAEAWPGEIVPLKKFGEFSAGAYSSRYIANLLSQDKGPSGAFKLGRNTILPKSSSVQFLLDRLEV
ncbi:hypothetical protein [Desulfosediminicola ganghwensis]|uniref:hypothetical protein n=1 Tax=Desulfosediminicola ganghwensis TaxID=2569540 RepID=UPI0010AC4906|nr:hypothetical protein [Desulfosediminicola ganghwensis]